MAGPKAACMREVGSPLLGRGALMLHSMPGRLEDVSSFLEAVGRRSVSMVVSLASLDEIAVCSPEYASAIASGAVPCPVAFVPVEDFGVPADRDGFADFARRLAKGISSGERVLVHCGAGIGRTGTLAECLLIALGASADEARSSVEKAGSHTETEDQRSLVEWFAGRIRERETGGPDA